MSEDPVAAWKRRQALQLKRSRRQSLSRDDNNDDEDDIEHRDKNFEHHNNNNIENEHREIETGDVEEEPLFIPVKRRKQQLLEQFQLEGQERAAASSASRSAAGSASVPVEPEIQSGPRAKVTLVEKSKEIKRQLSGHEDEKMLEEENKMLESAAQSVAPLLPVAQRSPIATTWRAPRFIEAMNPAHADLLRTQFHIAVQGERVPNPVPRFEWFKFPRAILGAMQAKGISQPTPIQMQALPAILAGRDLIGVAFTGTGKTLVFTLPMILLALQEELRLPVQRGEGPLALILCPSRELARQTFEVVQYYVQHLCGNGSGSNSGSGNISSGNSGNSGSGNSGNISSSGNSSGNISSSSGGNSSGNINSGNSGNSGNSNNSDGFPELRTLLIIGGTQMKEQSTILYKGVHMVVATPGRLISSLRSQLINFDNCKYVCMDEADRLLDIGFEDDVRQVFDYFKPMPRQTVLFSATMPEKVQQFAKTSLLEPLIVNVGRAGAANLDVVQEVDFVKQEAKMPYLLEALQKTPPPVLIFCENKNDVDDIQEYLLQRGVEAVAIHGSKDQEDRESAIRLFKGLEKDVLVATDVVSKGLDFPDVKHVINYDMAKDIETYVHRIGRTGRRGQTGLATSFINSTQCSEQMLLDLKHLLLEAKQRIPPILQSLHDPLEDAFQMNKSNKSTKGCKYCGGLGHRITACPKYERDRQEKMRVQLGLETYTGTAAGANY